MADMTSSDPYGFDNDDYQAFLADAAKRCSCCPHCWECPCGACAAGGVCDRMTCSCNNDGPAWGDDDWEDDD